MMQKYKEIIKKAQEINPNVIVLDGYDNCVIGICENFHSVILLYSEKKIIEKLSITMPKEDAINYFDLHVYSSTRHDINTPVFLIDIDLEEE